MERYNFFKAAVENAEKADGNAVGCSVMKLRGDGITSIDNSVAAKVIGAEAALQGKYLELIHITDMTRIPDGILVSCMTQGGRLVVLDKVVKGCYVICEKTDAGKLDLTNPLSAQYMRALIKKRSNNKTIVLCDEIYTEKIAWSDAVAKSYGDRYGEDIIESLPLLFLDVEGGERFRVRYYKLLSELTAENFLIPVKAAADAASAHITATVIGKKGVYAPVLPDNLNLSGYCCFNRIVVDTSCSDPDRITLRRYSTLAQMLSRTSSAVISAETLLKENLNELKNKADRLFSGGINRIIVSDSQKVKDNPLYKHKYEYFREYCNLLSAALREAKQVDQMLVFYPTSTLYAAAYPRSGKAADIERLVKSFDKNGMGYLLCDEILWETAAVLLNTDIIIGNTKYSEILLADAGFISSTAANKLAEFVSKGGKTYILGDEPQFIDGDKTEKAAKALKTAERIKTVTDTKKPSLFSFKEDISVRFGRLTDGSILVFAADVVGSADVQKIRFNTKGTATFLNLLSISELYAVDNTFINRIMRKKDIDLSRAGTKSVLLRVSDTGRGINDMSSYKFIEPSEDFTLKKCDNNTLPIGTASFRTGRGKWNNETRLSEICEQIITGKKASVELRLTFNIEKLPRAKSVDIVLPEKLQAKVTLNGEDTQELRHVYRGGNLKVGENTIGVLIENAHEQLTDTGIIDSILVKGKFAVIPMDGYEYVAGRKLVPQGEFAITQIPDSIDISRITENGFWHFSGDMEFTTHVYAQKKSGNVYKFAFSEFSAELCSISVNGIPAGTVGFAPYELVVSDLLYDGDNEVTVKLIFGEENTKWNELTEDGKRVFRSLGVKPSTMEKSYTLTDDFISTDGVTKEYKCGDHTVLTANNHTFTVQKGEFVALTGNDGSGKSTFINLLAGITRCDEGEMVIDGKKITDYTEEELLEYRRNDVGIVSLDGDLMPNLTVRENVQLAARICKTPLDTQSVLSVAGLSDNAEKLPEELSFADIQRTALARALVKNPKLIPCDEPTARLDYKDSKAFIGLLLDICKNSGRTIIMATHNSAITRVADRTLRLRDGFIVETAVNPEPVSVERMDW